METFFEEFQHLRIQLEKIKLATDNFDDKRIIGAGGFGKVYEGELSHFRGRSMVAFKRLDHRFGQGNPEFWKEITMLSRYTHKNLISLLGFCDEDGEKILIYEHASNGSLDRHLRSATFTWIKRLKICLDAARGLSYLHDDKGTQQRVLHRDIKSSNILLDVFWNAKVSDMGLSKIGPANQQHTALFTNVVGTLGYLDPMYMELGMLTKESDVYSFGVVLFEVLCGRLCFENSNGRFLSLVRMWKQKYKQKKLDEIIFQDLMQEMDSRSLETFADISFQCLQKYRGERPTMSYVVEKLMTALEFQEIYEEMKHPMDYEKIIATTVHPVTYKSEEELKSCLSKGILLNGGKTVEHAALKDDKVDMQTIPASDDSYWKQKLPNDYSDIIKWSKDDVKWTTKKELYTILCKGFLISNSQGWFFLAKTGKRCLMLPARTALIKGQWKWKYQSESRFEEVAFDPTQRFSIVCKITSQILSPKTTYACFLVYKLLEKTSEDLVDFEFPLKVKDGDFDDERDWELFNRCRFIYLLHPKTPIIRPKVDQ